ncbi:imidazole glycerol phosphate synthase subunit HisH [Longispora fulva]|uniref:Imidazole glycerol phosphate synthase subunit HisH n=1 Tax=Longispora fulva TaxID=619741 RepID=A0A8J7GXP2_9ACTN|nr:imidazole glycerol phosphate synthase subunit HisH [Longispora fulva]MBG6141215.1 glutamine amidotransferase [Longispora fulva]GIG62789.1 imidazole glycerol phosphate synthase subunit HisH [Longispora fulva]
MSRVVVLDYGSGNLRSAERAMVRAGADVTVTDDLALALEADGLVVPGVGAYAACVAGLLALGGDATIRERLRRERPVLGICVGAQIMFGYGDEHGTHTEGLGLLPGGVTRLKAPVVPHMGWSPVAVAPGSVLFDGVEGERFYFVHSYAARPWDAPGVTTATHGEEFVAAVEAGALSVTQFHPEKSGDAGARLLRNWVATL